MLIRLFFSFILISSLMLNSSLAANLVTLDSPQGREYFDHSQAKVDFFSLANNFVPQENKMYCGLASSAIVLNSLRLGNPNTNPLPLDNSLLSSKDQIYLPKGFNPIFERYTQNNLLNEKTKTKSQILGEPIIIKDKKISDYGLQLKQLADVLSANGVNVKVRVADTKLSNKTIRDELVINLQTAGDYVLINYSRKILGQGDAGHISPLGAYDSESDSFLIMDVNPNTSKWYWVKLDDLIASMRTFDVTENRGYLLIKE